ncbi:MAG: carboxymuconolactone decarboxylase family protein [Paracoccaceae bacterium]
MDWKAELDNTNANMSGFRKERASVADGFTSLHKAAMADGALPRKEKELIALSIGIARQCVDCIGFHVKAAAAAGATREEVADAVGVCMMMGGGPSFMYGVKALEAYDQLCA